jgi:CheY-like chemotaxis protein
MGVGCVTEVLTMADGLTAKVLCVDDLPDVAESTALLLESLGFEARYATSGPAALELAAEYRPDACVLDISMPGMDGYELARRLREQLGAVYLVAVTGTYGGEHDQKLTEAGFDLRLIKPADPAALLAVLEKGTTRAAD